MPARAYVGTMSHHDSTGSDQHDDEGGTVSEAGSGAPSPETSLGGADSVPDTPDVNDPLEGGGKDVNVADDEALEE